MLCLYQSIRFLSTLTFSHIHINQKKNIHIHTFQRCKRRRARFLFFSLNIKKRRQGIYNASKLHTGAICHNAQLTPITPTYMYTFNAKLMMLFGQRYTITFFVTTNRQTNRNLFSFFPFNCHINSHI
jgi:hypothetical protein